MRSLRHPAALGAIALLGATLATMAASSSDAGGQGKPAKNPCLGDRQGNLLCPDLRMRPPFDIQRAMVNGHPVLRAANSIDSVGRGPASLRGHRSGPKTMNARQWIKKQGGGFRSYKTGAQLYFKNIPGQGPYWKFRNAAKFSLFRLDENGVRIRSVQTGEKQVYCLRDLEHTHPGLPRSPDHPHYPACSQDPNKQRVTLGTSVGWSDVYPYSYHEQYISLRHIPKNGCYAFQHKADPKHHMFEERERNNAASTVVFLTKRGGYKPNRCQGVRDQGLPARQSTDDSQVSHGDDPEYPRTYQP